MTPPVPPEATSASRDWLVAWSVVLGAAVLRSLLAAFVPLLPDETYYWEWTRHLAGGYFDHPPGIALLIRAGTIVLGDTTAGVRAGSAFAAILTHVAVIVTAASLARGAATELPDISHSARAARRAAWLVALLPLATLGLVLATPDAALFLCASIALLAVQRALSTPVRSSKSLAWWCVAGVALGAAFVSKYTAVLLPMALTIAFAVHPRLRRRFAEPGPYVASAIALGLFAPVVLWNRANDWASFRFQLGHGFNAVSRGNPLTRELELVGGQLGLATPVLFALLAVSVAVAFRGGRHPPDGVNGVDADDGDIEDVDAAIRRDRKRIRAAIGARDISGTDIRAQRFAFALLAGIPLLFFAISAWRRTVEANWPALIYPAAIALLASERSPWATGRLWRGGLGLAGAVIVILTLQAWRPLLPLAPRKDPIARAHGWSALAASVDSATHDPFFTGSRTTHVAADRYQDASELAFHLPRQPRVYSLNLGGRTNQYALWTQLESVLRRDDGVIVVFDANPQGDTVALRVARSFARTHHGPTIALTRGRGEVAHRALWLFRDQIAPLPSGTPIR